MLSELLEFGGLGLAGGIISDIFGSKQAKKNRALTREQMAMAQRQFDAQMDQSVQRRVKDAQSAGIHPLFALGGSVGASPTAAIGGGEPVRGSATGRAIANMGAALLEGKIKEGGASAKRDEAEAMLLDARRKVIEQELNSQGRDTISEIEVERRNPSGLADFVRPQVMKHRPGEPGVEAGNRPGNIRVVTKDGRTVDVPSPELGLDEISQVDYVYQRAIHYTTDALEAYLRANRWLTRNAKKALRSIHKHVGGRPVR